MWTAKHYSPSGTSLRAVAKESPLGGQNFRQCTWSFAFLGRRNDQMRGYVPIYGLWPTFLKIFVSYVNTH